MKFQSIVLASFLVMPYALADDQASFNRMQRHRRLMQ